MYAGGAGGNDHGVPRLGAEHVPGRSHELGEHEGGRSGRPGLEVLPRRGDGALEGGGEREAREPRLQRLEAAAVILARYRPRREQRLRDAHHEPQGEQPVAYGPPGRLGGERDEPLLGGRGGPPPPPPPPPGAPAPPSPGGGGPGGGAAPPGAGGAP